MEPLQAIASFVFASPELTFVGGILAGIVLGYTIYYLEWGSAFDGAKIGLLFMAVFSWYFIYSVAPETGLQRVLYRLAGWGGPGLTFLLVTNELRERGKINLDSLR